jgi:signal transduction histidine kinase
MKTFPLGERLNSLQVRLYLLVILGFFIAITFTVIIFALSSTLDYAYNEIIVTTRMHERADQIQARVNDIIQTNSDNAEIELIAEDVAAFSDEFDAMRLGMRLGDASLELDGATEASVLGALDEVDVLWGEYVDQLSAFFEATPAERTTQYPLVLETSNEIFEAVDALIEVVDIEADLGLQALRNLAAAFLVAIFGLVFVFAYTVLQIGRSINGLARTARQLAEGDLTIRANIFTLNEVAEVGGVLNTMAEHLQTTFADLQAQVATAQFERAHAEQADKVKSAFLASMSHELRTPLNAIINYTKFVTKGVMGEVNDRQKEALGKVIESGKHLLDLINDVLDISKIESGSLHLFVEENIDPKDILRGVAETARGLLGDKPVRLRLEIADDLPPMKGDRGRIRQIMLNMVSNACKFTEHGHIILHAYHDLARGELRFAVADTGPGIAKDDCDAVFESFRQTETGLRQGGGTGLGMPISKSLAEAHGGRLWFESAPGEGSTFFVALPVASPLLVPTL